MKKDFKALLEERKIPIVTLDPKWHEIFRYVTPTSDIKRLEEQLGEALKKQGKANTETKDIKKIKAKLMEEVLEISAQMNGGDQSSKLEKQMADKKRLISECNEKLEAYQDDILEIPAQIDAINKELMLETLELCYVNIKKNTEELAKINEWIDAARIQLKKQVLRKVDRENKNKDMYAFLHDIFGADVLDAFDLGTPDGLETKKEKMTES